MAKKTIYENVVKVREETTLATWEITPDLFAIKRTINGFVTSSEGSMQPERRHISLREEQGFVDAGNLEAIVAGTAWTFSDVHHVLTQQGQELLRMQGLFMSTEADKEIFTEANPNNVYDALEKGIVTEADVFRFDESLGVSFDIYGRVLPEAITFAGLSDGGMDNEHYDLEKLFAHLSMRDDIRFLPTKARKANMHGRAETFRQAVRDIDEAEYDDSINATRQVVFTWSPRQEDAQTLWDAIKAKGGPFTPDMLHDTIRELDLFGLRAAGAELTDDDPFSGYDTGRWMQ